MKSSNLNQSVGSSTEAHSVKSNQGPILSFKIIKFRSYIWNYKILFYTVRAKRYFRENCFNSLLRSVVMTRSFTKRQTSDKEWQQATTIGTTSDNEWQLVTTSGTTSDNKWYNERQRMTSENEWYNEWQRVTTSDYFC